MTVLALKFRLSSPICDAEIEEMIVISDSAQPQALDGSGE